jgi:hypothetical protein
LFCMGVKLGHCRIGNRKNFYYSLNIIRTTKSGKMRLAGCGKHGSGNSSTTHFGQSLMLLLLRFVGPAGTPPIALQSSRPFVL